MSSKEKVLDVNDLPSLAGLSAQVLTEGYLEEFLYDVTVAFNGCFEQAPVLPRPLPGYIPWSDDGVEDRSEDNNSTTSSLKHYQFISMDKLMKEVEAAAPGCRLEPRRGHNVVVRRLSQLRLLYFKAREFSDIHYTLYLQKQATADQNSNIVTGVTMGVTVVLYFFGTNYQATVAFYSAIATIAVSTLNSWSTFKKYEEEANDHKAASVGFQDIAGRIAATLDTAKSVSHVLNEEIKGLLVLQPSSVRAKATPGIMRRLLHSVVPTSVRKRYFSSTSSLLKTDLKELKTHPLFEHFVKIKAVFELVLNLLDPNTVTNKIYVKITSSTNSGDPQKALMRSLRHAKFLNNKKFYESYARLSRDERIDYSGEVQVLVQDYKEVYKGGKIEVKNALEEADTNAEGIKTLKNIFIGQLPQEVHKQFIVASKLLDVFTRDELKELQSSGSAWEKVRFMVKKISSDEESMKFIADPLIKLYLYYVPGALHKTLRVASHLGKNSDLRGLIVSACEGVPQNDGGWLSKELVLDRAVEYGLVVIKEKFSLQVCKYLHEQFVMCLLGATKARVFDTGVNKLPGKSNPTDDAKKKTLRVLCQVVAEPRVFRDLLSTPEQPQSIEWDIPAVEQGSKKLRLNASQEDKIVGLIDLWKGKKIIIGSATGSGEHPVEIRTIVDKGSVVLDQELEHSHTGEDCRIISTTKFLDSLGVLCKGEPLAELVLQTRHLHREMMQTIMERIDVAKGEIRKEEGRMEKVEIEVPKEEGSMEFVKISLQDNVKISLKGMMEMSSIKTKMERCMQCVLGSNDGVDAINRRLQVKHKLAIPISKYPYPDAKRENLESSDSFLLQSPRGKKEKAYKEEEKAYKDAKSRVTSMHTAAQEDFMSKIEDVAKSDCLQEAVEAYGVNPVALFYLSQPQELIALLKEIKKDSLVEKGELHLNQRVKHYGLVEAIEMSGIRMLIFQALKDRPETVVSDKIKKKLAKPTYFLELLLEGKKEDTWVQVRDGLLPLFPLMLKHVVSPVQVDSSGQAEVHWFESALQEYKDPTDPAIFLKLLMRDFTSRLHGHAVEHMCKDLLPCLTHLLHRKLKSLLKFYLHVLTPVEERLEEKGKRLEKKGKSLALIIREKFTENRGNSAKAVSEVASEFFDQLFEEGDTARELLGDLVPYLQEELSDRTISLINLPTAIKQEINGLLSKGFLDDLGEEALEGITTHGELLRRIKERGKESIGRELSKMQDESKSKGDIELYSAVRNVVMKSMKVKLRRIAQGNLYDLRSLLKSMEPDMLYTIGGPLLPMMVEQFDHFAKSLQGLNLTEINNFIRDPRKALAKAEAVVKNGLSEVARGAPGEVAAGAGGGGSRGGGGDDDDALVSANEKLQVILRRSLEYAAAHKMSGQQFEQQHLVFSFFALTSATATSLLLFSSSNSENKEASSASDTNSTGATWGSLAANITAVLTIIKNAASLSAQANRQYDTANGYLDLVHQVEYLLVKQTADDQEESLREISARFYQIRANSPPLPLPKLTDFFMKPREAHKREREEQLFKVISDDPLRFEKFAIMLFPDDRKGRKHPLQAPVRRFLREVIDETGLAEHFANLFYYCCLPAQKLSKVMPVDAGGVGEALEDMRRASVGALPLYTQDGSGLGIQSRLGGSGDFKGGGCSKAGQEKVKKRGLFIDSENKEKMRSLDFLETFDNLESDFSSAESTMPSIPYNLDAQYNFITWRARFREAEKRYPLKQNEENSDPLDPLHVLPLEAEANLFDSAYVGKTRSERMLLMLHRIFCLSAEYCEVHYTLAQKNKRLLTNLNLFCLFLSTLITVVLIYFGTDHPQSDRVMLVTGSMASLISAILSWSKFAQYDALGASHEVAFAKFVAICSEIESLFLRLRRFTEKFENEAILEALDECILDEEEESEDDESDSDDDDDDSDSDSSSD